MHPRFNDIVRAIRTSPREVGVGAVAGLALLYLYWPTLSDMAGRWGSDPRYSFGFIVPVFAFYLLWVRRNLLPSGPLQPQWWGLVLLGAGLAVRFAGILYTDWLEAVSLLPCLVGLCVLLGGGQLLRWAWPAVAFLIFMMPLPYTVEVGLANDLQRIASWATNYTLQTLGFVSFREGNIIRLGPTKGDLNVAEACSGLSMLLVFFAISTAVIILKNPPWYEKLLIFVSAVPIAVLANVFRLTVTGIVQKTVGFEEAHYFHDSMWAAGMMIGLALGCLWLELKVLGWIVVPRVVRESPTVAMSMPGKPAPVPAAGPTAPADNKKESAVTPADKRKVVLPGLGLAVAPRSEPQASAPKGAK